MIVKLYYGNYRLTVKNTKILLMTKEHIQVDLQLKRKGKFFTQNLNHLKHLFFPSAL